MIADGQRLAIAFARMTVLTSFIVFGALPGESLVPRAYGQSSTASLSGTAIDESNGVVPEVDW